MPDNLLPLQLEAIFLQACNQPSKRTDIVFSPSYNGPVPEESLQHLLNALEEVICQAAASKYSEFELTGLRIFYDVEKTKGEQLDDLTTYWAGWGDEKLLEMESEDSEEIRIENLLSSDLFGQTLKLLKQQILEPEKVPELVDVEVNPFFLYAYRGRLEGSASLISARAGCKRCNCTSDSTKRKRNGGCYAPPEGCCP